MPLDPICRIPLSDPRYPALLAAIHDPPPILWIRGCQARLSSVMVAIVGSRSASPYGLEVAFRLAAELAGRGVTIVSGLARGIDSAAHRGALEGGGGTVAVFGCGVDVIYPREHARLAAQICEGGTLLTEFPPGTPPRAGHFPQRNRIISGLSRAVVIVEAAQKSGSLITARMALDQGRDVLAVPGNILSGRNSGAHALLRDGARLVESAEDVLDEIRMGAAVPGAPGSSPWLPASEDPILHGMIPGEPYDLDQLAALSGMNRVALLPRLLELEIGGAVQRADGGRFVRLHAAIPLAGS